MRTFLFFFVLVAASLPSAAQSRQIQVQPFEIVRAYGPFRITLVESDKERMEVAFNGIDEDEIVIDSDDGELEMKLRNKHYWNDWNDSGSRQNNRHVKVTVYFKKLKEIDVEAGASVTSDAAISSPSLMLISRMGAEMRLDVRAKELELDSSMGSEVELTGTTETLEVHSKMGSRVNAIRLKSEKVWVRAYMGSDVTVYASQELDASAGFGATINFGGDPSVRNTSHSFGGTTNATKR
jgi:hypothetical protein